MKVPYLDLKLQYQKIKPEIDEAIQNTIENCTFVLGPDVKSFEDNFAQYCGVDHAVGVNSGTAALHLALLALGIDSGDEVITVSNSFFATAESVSLCGGFPVFVDIDEKTHLMNPDLIESKITPNTKAIIPVHLYGKMCDMDKIMEIAKKHNLIVIEDACQAHGATYKGKKAGSFGKAAAFSFYPGKNLGAYGEAGMITTNDHALAETCRLLRTHGEHPKSEHTLVGYNYRMAGIQGAILNVKLKYLDEWNSNRRKSAALYTSLLQGVVDIPEILQDTESAFHLYVIRHPQRDKLRTFLSEQGIPTGIHYAKPIHLQKPYSYLKYQEGDYPITEKVVSEIVSLPICPEMTEEHVRYVAEKVREFTTTIA